VLACASCTRSRDPQDGGAAHGGGEAGKGGKAGTADAGGKAGTGGQGDSGAPGPSGGKGGDGGMGPMGGGTPGSVMPVKGGYCCTPNSEPGCCMVYGGFTTQKDGCGAACDGMPSPWEDWKLETDEHGCKYWVEPREWTDCCGCGPHTRACNPNGTWKIKYEPAMCGPTQDVFTVSSDDDAGTAEVTFQGRGLAEWMCGGSSNATYEATAMISENGCVLTLGSHSKSCWSGEGQCDDLDIKVYLNPFKSEAEVEGTSRKCWCGTSGPEGLTVDLKGIATPMN
jgi:hypothetical protein